MAKHGWVGFFLLALGQFLTWVHVQPLCEYWYGIAWLGFILVADALTLVCKNFSLLKNRQRDFFLMFAISALIWWGCELANVAQLNNWNYSESPSVPLWLQRLRATFFFSTLIPATWEATLLALSLPWANKPISFRARTLPNATAVGIMMLGILLGVLAFFVPSLSLLFGLLSIVLFFDALNFLRGVPSLLASFAQGDARLLLGICGGSLFTGVLGEFWNYWAIPKWTYHVAYFDFAHIFEMPLLGYGGYPLLALAIFAVYHFVRSFIPSSPRASDGVLARTGL